MDTGPIFDKANKMLEGNLLWTGGGGITILFFASYNGSLEKTPAMRVQSQQHNCMQINAVFWHE